MFNLQTKKSILIFLFVEKEKINIKMISQCDTDFRRYLSAVILFNITLSSGEFSYYFIGIGTTPSSSVRNNHRRNGRCDRRPVGGERDRSS